MSKTILITGASSGIGRSTAIKFQQEGWNVVATMRTPEKETELNQLDHVVVTRLDVQDKESITAAFAEGIKAFGTIDVVVNNAGYGLMGTFESASDEAIRRQFDVNVFGLFDVTKAALPHFRANKSGVFINISSIGGKMTFPIMPLYHATKFAVEGFSESLHYELNPLGIKVKVVEPGGVATDFGGRSMDFQHDQTLTDYNELVAHLNEAFAKSFDPETMSTPAMIADVIFTAATDNTDTIRYRAGKDAEQLLTARKQMNDDAFIGMMKQQLGL